MFGGLSIMLSLDEIVRYFAAERPDWAAAIVPASAHDIARLEALADRPLAPVHRRYLELLGREPGTLLDTYVGADTRIERLIEHFETGGWRPQPPYSLFGRDAEGSPLDLFLCDQGEGSPTLVAFGMPGGARNLRFDGPDRPTLHAPDLPSFVYRAGFDNLIGTRFAHFLRGRVVAPQLDDPARLDAALAQVGLRHEQGSDAWTSSHRAHEAAVQWLRNGAGQTLWIRAWADDIGLLERIALTMQRTAEVVVDGLHPAGGPVVLP